MGRQRTAGCDLPLAAASCSCSLLQRHPSAHTNSLQAYAAYVPEPVHDHGAPQQYYCHLVHGDARKLIERHSVTGLTMCTCIISTTPTTATRVCYSLFPCKQAWWCRQNACTTGMQANTTCKQTQSLHRERLPQQPCTSLSSRCGSSMAATEP